MAKSNNKQTYSNPGLNEILDWKDNVQTLKATTNKTTCEVFIAAEAKLEYTNLIKEFIRSANADTENVVKCLQFEDVVQNVLHFAENQQTPTKVIPTLYKYAASECIEYLNSGKTIPSNIMAYLTKLQIAFIIDADEDVRKRKHYIEQELEKLRVNMIEGNQQKKGGKGKDDKKPADKKPKVQPPQDGCASTVTSKITSHLLHSDADAGTDLSQVDIQDRHLYLIMVGFYDFDLVVHLLNADISIAAIFQLESNGTEQSLNEPTPKSEALKHFWTRVYEHFEGEKNLPLFKNTFFERIPINGNVFQSVGTCAAKAIDIRRQHVNYLRNLKLFQFEPEPQRMRISQLKVYSAIMDLIPPDCISVELILFALVQEVCVKRGQFDSFSALRESQEHRGFKGHVGNVLKRSLKGRFKTPNEIVGEYTQNFSCKTTYELNIKPFLIEMGNYIEIKLKAYKKLASILLEENLAMLTQIYPVLLWKGYRLPNINDNDLALYNIAEQFQAQAHEIHYYIQSIAFARLKNCVKPENWLRVYEAFSQSVMLQELYKAERDFLFCDHKYCEFDDSLLLRYYNDVDQSGVNTTLWHEPIRTSLTLPEFFRFIFVEDRKWIVQEEENFQKNYNKEFKKAYKLDCELRRTVYSDLVFQDYHFIQPNSLKSRALLEIQMEAVDNKKKDKGSKPDGKAKKGKKDEGNENMLFLEKLTKPTPYPNIPQLTPRFATDNEPYSFYAYDLGEGRLQLTGTTTTFLYGDLKLTIDSARFLGDPEKISLKAEIDGTNLIVYPTEQKTNFVFTLNDQTVAVFVPPYKPDPPEVKLAKKICEALQKTAEKRQNIYFVSQQQNCVVKCLDVPYLTKRSIIMAEEMVQPFLEQMKLRGLSAAVKESSTDLHTASGEESDGRKRDYSVISKTSSNINENKSKSGTNYKEIQAKISAKSIKKSCQSTPKHIVKKIKNTVEAHLPLFNICSSKLHRYRYVRRIKSHVNVEIGGNLKRITCKPPIFTRNCLKIQKLLPVKRCELNYQYNYDTRVSLPSGLTLSTVAGTNENPFYIKQLYIDKGPQCMGILGEYSRTFMRDGNILIKKTNGDVIILGNNGQIVHCEVPYVRIKRGSLSKRKSVSNLTALHINSTDLHKFQKSLYHTIKRLYKNTQSTRKASHVHCQSWKKFRIKDPNQIYILRKSTENWNKFFLITADGKKLKITKKEITQEKKYNLMEETDYRHEENYWTREDGTSSILYREGCLITHFPDGTRITTWPEIEPNLLFLNEVSAETLPSDFIDKEQQVSSTDFEGSSKQIGHSETLSEALYDEFMEEDEFLKDVLPPVESTEEKLSIRSSAEYIEIPWTSIYMNTKYEHPNYATVIFHGQTKKCEIILPNEVSIESSSTGECKMFINNITASVNRDTVCLQKDKLKTVVDLNFKSKLLQVTEASKKIFNVDNHGVCCNNIQQSSKQDKQALFVLTRCLKGCKFWTAKELQAYRAQNENITASEKYIENKIYVNQFWHQKFVIPYLEPTLSLTKYKRSDEDDERQVAYVMIQMLEYLPDISKYIFPILTALYADKECEFVQLLEGIAEEQYRTKLLEEKKVSVVVEVKPKSDLRQVYAEKIAKWREVCNRYRKNIRENNIPCYFTMKPKQVKRELPAICKTESTCKCATSDSIFQDTTDYEIQSINDIEALSGNSETFYSDLPKKFSSERDSFTFKDAKKSKLRFNLEDGQDNTVKEYSKTEVTQEPNSDNGKEEELFVWHRNSLSDLLLQEIKTTITDYIFPKDAIISKDKVRYLTRKLLCCTQQAVSEYDVKYSLKEFVPKTVIALIANLKRSNPTSGEIAQILRNITSFISQPTVDKELPDTTIDTSELYNIYKYYSNDMLKPIYKCNVRAPFKVGFRNELRNTPTEHDSIKSHNSSPATSEKQHSGSIGSGSAHSDDLEWFDENALGLTARNEDGGSMTVLLDTSMFAINEDSSSDMSVDAPAFTDRDPAASVPVPRTIQRTFQDCSECELLAKKGSQGSRVMSSTKVQESTTDIKSKKCIEAIAATVSDGDHDAAKTIYPSYMHPHFNDKFVMSPTIPKKLYVWNSVGTQTNLQSMNDTQN